MLLGYITLITALIISISAAAYSILGLTAIFASAFWPVVILGASLEVGKIVTTLWLHKHWDRARLQYKIYLSFSVAALMVMTSMGVFGFLSKAHSDQSLVSGDVTAKIAIYDEKIKTERENIDANRKALKQMDEAVDQIMGRSSTEAGADRSVAVRRSQQKERTRLLADITESQKKISALNEERAPIAAEVRKVDAEVGPIKYIAALIYGDNPDQNILEKSVRWVIILIVSVFDPLALTLLLAATQVFEWEKEDKEKSISSQKPNDTEIIKTDFEGVRTPDGEWIQTGPEFEYVHNPIIEDTKYEPDDGPLTEEEIKAIIETANEALPKGDIISRQELFPKTQDPDYQKLQDDIEPYGNEQQQHAMKVWKADNPGHTYIEYLEKLDRKEIDHLPWEHPEHFETLNLSDRDLINLKLGLEADNEPSSGEVKGFGIEFPKFADKGDMFLRVDNLPSQLYKYNGAQWIRVNKNLSDGYIYDDAYINHLIEKVGSGEYDPDLLSDAERERISEKLKNNPSLG